MKKVILPLITIFALMGFNVNAQQTHVLFGTCQVGGTYNKGTIFQADSNGNNIHTVYSFDSIHGTYPTGNLVQVNGKIYGVTGTGGCQNYGVLFEFDPITDTITYSYDFCSNGIGGAHDGMIFGSDGNLFGLHPAGGTYGFGFLYRFNPNSHILDTLYNFNSTTGGSPIGRLLQLNNKLYGMAFGGTYNQGVLFSFNLSSNSYDTLVNLNGTNGTGEAGGNLILASDGKIYGLTYSGGTNNFGVIFSYDTVNNTYSVVYDFDFIHGANAGGSLIQATDGKLYGMNNIGGQNNYGVLFNFDISTSVCSVLVNFNGANGMLAVRELIQASNGLLFGTTQEGGANTYGTAFSYNITTQVLTTLISFDNSTVIGGLPFCDILEATILTTSIPNIQNNTIFTTFPNPASNQITIQTSKQEVLKFIDVLGKEVCPQLITNNSKLITQIDISSFPNIFFIKSASGEVKKVVRE